jgi:hypothetical protein
MEYYAPKSSRNSSWTVLTLEDGKGMLSRNVNDKNLHKVFALMEFYAPKSSRNSSWTVLTLEDGKGRLSRNVGNYQSVLRNIPEQ